MEKFELQEPTSQLFNALKRHFLRVNFFQICCSEQLKKSHHFSKIIFVTSSLQKYIIVLDKVEEIASTATWNMYLMQKWQDC